MPKISAVMITFNEELFIDKCLASIAGIADEIIVVDRLRESIINIKDNWEYDGYQFNRRNNFCGKWRNDR